MFRLGKSFIGVSRSLVNIRMMSSKRIFFANIPWTSTNDQVGEHFGQVGNIVDLHLFKRPDGKLIGSGVIEYDNPESAQKAVETLHDADFAGRKLLVREDQGKPDAPKRTRNFDRGDRNGDRRQRRDYDNYER